MVEAAGRRALCTDGFVKFVSGTFESRSYVAL